MKSVRIRETQRRVKDLDFNSRYGQMGRHLRRKADALQARRWRKLNRHMNGSPYLDSQVKHGGSIL
jgi:hypothetical protein